MRLAVIVIRILPQNHDTHIRERRQFEGSIDVFGSREDTMSPAFGLYEPLQLPEIRLRKFIRCNRPPTSRETLRNVHNVSQGAERILLPREVGECFICVSHAVYVFTLVHRSAFTAEGCEQFFSQ